MKTLTLHEFANQIINDPAYRQSVVTRAAAGTLPEDIELAILDAAASRVPAAPLRKQTPPAKLVPFATADSEAR